MKVPALQSRLVRWGVAMAATLVLAACSAQIHLDVPERQPLIPPDVDSLAVPVFAKGDDLLINTADLALLHTLLREQLELRPNLRTFDKPPTSLSNSMRLMGHLDRYDVREARGDGLFLREINLKVTLRLLPATGDEELAVLTRSIGYQRVYLPTQQNASLVFDLRNAVRELAIQLAEQISPLPDRPEMVLDKGLDPVTGDLRAHPLLIRGNKRATERLYQDAMRLWRLVLFDPTLPAPEKPLYRVSLRTLRTLQRQGLPKQVLDALRPMTERGPLELVPFQTAMRVALGGPSQFEGAVLENCNHAEDGINLNLSTAHFNLAALYEAEKRWDLSAFHLAASQVHYPAAHHLETWSRVQKARTLYPGEMAVEDAIAAYMRVPPPITAVMVPGAVAARMLPAPFLQPESVLTGAPPPPAAAPPAPVAVQPVQPISPDGPESLPTIEQPGSR